MFFIESVNILNNPLSSLINTTKQIILFLHVFEFQEPSRRQMDPNFLPHIFLENRRPCEEVNVERNEAPRM